MLQELGRRPETVVRVLRRGSADEDVEVGGDRGDDGRRLGNALVDVPVGDLDQGVTRDRLAPGQHLEEDQTRRVDVAALVGGTASTCSR